MPLKVSTYGYYNNYGVEKQGKGSGRDGATKI